MQFRLLCRAYGGHQYPETLIQPQPAPRHRQQTAFFLLLDDAPYAFAGRPDVQKLWFLTK